MTSVASEKKKSGKILKFLRKNYVGWLFNLPLAIGIVVFTLIPVIFSLIMSFYQSPQFVFSPSDWMDTFVGFENYEKLSDLQKNVNGLPGTQNVLAFYTPTFDLAQKLNEELKLTDWNFPILLLVGSVIERDGIVKAFYLPDHRNKTKELQNLSLENLVEGDGNSE